MIRNIVSRNYFECAGRVERKFYSKSNQRMDITLGIYLPNAYSAGTIHRDYIRFRLEGDEAVKWNEKIERGEYLTITGHLALNEHMIPVGGFNYQRHIFNDPVIESITKSAGKMYRNTVVVSGKIGRVVRNEEKHFYRIGVDTETSGETQRVEIVYFDSKMSLEPAVGGNIHVSGVLRSRETPVESAERQGQASNGHTRTVSVYTTGVIGQVVSITERKER